eukprot:14613173-Alexandrium_andersonii.AAC.1
MAPFNVGFQRRSHFFVFPGFPARIRRSRDDRGCSWTFVEDARMFVGCSRRFAEGAKLFVEVR